MSTDISAPYVPPDNILLSTNAATGALQFKPATQGDILLAGASGVWATLGIGAISTYLTSNGTTAAWAPPPDVQGWTKIETLNPAAATTITTAGTYTTYDEIMFRISVYGTTADSLAVRINGDSGANYEFIQIAGTTTTNTTGATSCKISGWSNNGAAKANTTLIVPGNTGAASAGGMQLGYVSGVQQGTSHIIYLGGNWNPGSNNTHFSSATFLSGNGFTGKIECFARVFQ